LGLCRALVHSGWEPLPEPLVGKIFSGRFVLRVEPALHRHLAAQALAAGESLNSYCARILYYLLNISRAVQRKFHWDARKEQFAGDDETNMLLSRPRRKGYELPRSRSPALPACE
jgi:hypothetical protein